MALAGVLQESDLGVMRTPWEIAPNGVVSLLQMLEFSAKDYVELSHQIGLLLGAFSRQQPDAALVGSKLGELVSGASRLGLPVTKEHLVTMIIELSKDSGAQIERLADGRVSIKGQIDQNRVCHHIETVYPTLRAELGAINFRAIAREKAKYCDQKWLTDTPLLRFPDTVDEFQRAGRCFAYGENTACIFHLMRVADFYFRKVAEKLGVKYDARNWHGIGEKISSEMEKKYSEKTVEWKHLEPFYAEILADIQAMGRGHRNPVLHELEKKYDEREALYMLTVIESFAVHAAKNL